MSGSGRARRLSPFAWLGVADLRDALPFGMMQCVLALCWVLPSAVIPIEALAILGSALNVSILFFGVSFVGVGGAFVMPWLVHLVGRRWIFAISGGCVAVSSVLLSVGTVPPLIVGLAFRVFGYLCVDVAFEVAIMERIPRRALARFEPVRMFFMAIGFLVGPWLGIWLSLHAGLWAPFALSAVLTIAVCAYALHAGFSSHPAGTAFRGRPPNPLRFVVRFVRQPRLRLAWLLAFGRSGWWTMFFIYTPIYCVQSGLGEELAGIVLSAAALPMLLVPLWGRLGGRIGLRALLAVGYLATGFVTIAVAAVSDVAWLGITLLLAGAACASWIDAAGNTLFFRAVHPHERTEMASVFTTYREAAQLGVPGVFAALLSVFALPAVFVASGVSMVLLTYLTRYIPRRY